MSMIREERQGAIEVWTLDNQARRNAISRQLLAELAQRVESLARGCATRVVVLTGAGEKAFCAGADLKERATMSPDEVRTFLQKLRQTLRKIELSDCIFLAAINGVAFGGGLELALACDLRLAAAQAELGLTEVRLGIIPGGGGTQRLTRLVGPGRAKELILTGKHVSAEEALRLGVVNQVCAPGELLGRALALARSIEEGAPIAVASAKHAIDRGQDKILEDALALELELYEQVLSTEDRLEALKAFAARRRPSFKGR